MSTTIETLVDALHACSVAVQRALESKYEDNIRPAWAAYDTARTALLTAFSTLERDAKRWRAFRDVAHVAANEDGNVYLGTILADDVDDLLGATDNEVLTLNGEYDFPSVNNELKHSRIAGAVRIERLWDANAPAALATLPPETTTNE